MSDGGGDGGGGDWDGGGGGFGGGGGGFGGGGFGGGGFGGGHHGGGFGGGHHHGFGGPGGGFGMGFGGPGPGMHPHHHHHHPGGGGGFFGGPTGGYVVGPGPVIAPWLGALAVGAVAGAAMAPYAGRDRGRPGMVVWREGGQEMSAKVNMLTVRICRAQNLKKVQMIGKQDPYVRAKLLYNGHKIGECRTSTHTDGGKNPTWENTRRGVFTFYVPATVALDSLNLVLDVINDNLVSDSTIGTTGTIALDRAATGQSKWWNVTTGGMLQATIELVTQDSHRATTAATAATAAPPHSGYGQPTSYKGGGGGGGSGGSSYGGGSYGSGPVAHATPSANVYGGAPVAAPVAPVDAPPPYEAHAAPQYRLPPVAPGATAPPSSGGGGYEKSSQYNGYGDAGAAPLPEARAVPVVGGVAGDDPFNARGAAASAAGIGMSPSAASSAAPAATYGPAAGIAGTGVYPSMSAYPAPATYQQQQLPQQYQQNPTNASNGGYSNGGYSRGRYGNM